MNVRPVSSDDPTLHFFQLIFSPPLAAIQRPFMTGGQRLNFRPVRCLHHFFFGFESGPIWFDAGDAGGGTFEFGFGLLGFHFGFGRG